MSFRVVKNATNILVDHQELISVVSIHFGGLAVYFDHGLSYSSLESVIFPCNDQGRREVKGVPQSLLACTNIP